MRERFGGPGPRALGEGLAAYREALDRFDAEAERVSARETMARRERDMAFAALAEEA